MDTRARLLPSSDPKPVFPVNGFWTIIIVAFTIPTMCFMAPYLSFRLLQEMGRIKFSMEPVVYAGLDMAADAPAGPPSFNVTLRARSTYGLVKQCTNGRAAMQVYYSGMTIAMADVEAFCIDPRGEKLIAATASSGWPVLPIGLQESMESDRRHGGVQLEVGFHFEYEEEALWVRCRTTLGDNKASPCNVYLIKGC